MVIEITQSEDALDLPLPSYQTAGAAGMDLYANLHGDLELKRGAIAIISAGFKMAVPFGYEAQVRPRSGLALKHGITLPNCVGTIDSDYRGEVCVPLINLGQADYVIRRGDRIAQMIIAKAERAELRLRAELSDTERGGGGFGHTGV